MVCRGAVGSIQSLGGDFGVWLAEIGYTRLFSESVRKSVDISCFCVWPRARVIDERKQMVASKYEDNQSLHTGKVLIWATLGYYRLKPRDLT